MKLDSDSRQIFSNVNAKRTDFTIDSSNDVIFNILRSQIYTDPISSTVREVLSNALDAQSEKGNMGQPLEIFLPGEYLVIRDFGVGISPDRLENVISKYGASTKRHTNDQIGGFGLGFKSPFSVCDMFLVITRFESKEYTYQFFIDESGRGSIQLVSEKECEPADTGTSIKIPVSHYKRQEFINAVFKYVQFWEVQPKIIGKPFGHIIDPPKVVLEGENWRVYDRNVGANVNLLVDSVPYVIDKYKYGNYRFPNNLVLVFKTGDIEVTATRESVRINDQSNETIKAALSNYEKTIFEHTKSKISQLTKMEDVLSLINETGPWKEQEWDWAGKKFNYPISSQESVLQVYIDSDYKLNKRTKSTSIYDKHIYFFTDKEYYDLTPQDSRRIKQYLLENDKLPGYVFQKKHSDICDHLKLVKIDDIKINYPKREKSPHKQIRGYVRGLKNAKNFPIETSAPIVYYTDWVELEKAGYTTDFSLLNHDFIRITEKSAKLVKGKDNWFTIDEYLKEKLFKNFSLEEIKEQYKLHRVLNQYNYLKDYLKECGFVAGDNKLKLNDKELKLSQFLYTNGKLGEVKLPNIHESYPLLEAFSEFYDSNRVKKYRKAIEDYIQMVKTNAAK